MAEEVLVLTFIKFNFLVKKILEHIEKEEFDTAYHDYNAANAIYEHIVDKASGDQLIKLYNLLENLYSVLLVKDLKYRLSINLKRHKLRKEPYKVKIKVPAVKYVKTKEKIDLENKKLSKLHELIKNYKPKPKQSTINLEDIQTKYKKLKFTNKFDSDFNKLINLIRKGKFKDVEKKYKKLFKE